MLTPIEAPSLSRLTNIRHGFFTTEGGVSSGIYATLNCGRGSNDDIHAVDENRRRVARHLGASSDDVVTPYQIHSPNVVAIDALVDRTALPKADGAVTATPGLAIGILTADCTPVLFADPEAGIVGAAHAGWRGAVGGVLDQTVAKMVALGAVRSRIKAAIGPCIHQDAYEVGHDFENNLVTEDPANAAFFRIPDGAAKPHFDLPGYVATRLLGLEISTIDSISQCTRTNESIFFSYRRSQANKAEDYGRQISAILVA